VKKFIVVILLTASSVFLLTLASCSKPSPKAQVMVAFVIDDWGWNKKYIDLALSIERPLAISILPNLPYSGYVAEKFRDSEIGHDIILHLPLESESNRAAEADTIRVDMDKKTMLSILEKDLAGLPMAVGVSNHQGSKATKDKELMKSVLDKIKKENLFFFDSLTTPDSACSKIAGDIKLKFAERDVFLDITNQSDPKNIESYVRGQIRELAGVALKKGRAIGVGHNKKTTLNVLKELIPELEGKGIKVVPLREMIK